MSVVYNTHTSYATVLLLQHLSLRGCLLLLCGRPGKRESGRQKRHDLYSQLSQPSSSSVDNSSSGVAIFMNNNTNNAANVSGGGDIVDEQEDVGHLPPLTPYAL